MGADLEDLGLTIHPVTFVETISLAAQDRGTVTDLMILFLVLFHYFRKVLNLPGQSIMQDKV